MRSARAAHPAQRSRAARRAWCTLLGAIALLLALAPSARAIGEATTHDARIVIPADQMPAFDQESTMSVWVWVCPTEAPTIDTSVFSIENVLRIGIDDKGYPTASTYRRAGEQRMDVTCYQKLPVGEWSLLVLSYHRITGRLELRSATRDTFVRAGRTWLGNPRTPGPVGRAFVGRAFDDTPAMIGGYGLVCVRRGLANDYDVKTVFQHRRYLGPFDSDRSDEDPASTLDGTFRARWMAFHAMTTAPVDRGAGGTLAERAAVVGQAIRATDFHTFDRTDPVGAGDMANFRVVRFVESAEGFTYASFRDPPYAGFFEVGTPGVAPATAADPIDAPVARQLIDGPRGTLRVLVSANSRAIRTDDGSGQSPGNFAHGFIDLNLAKTAGVFLRPATALQEPWFGFDTQAEPAWTDGPGPLGLDTGWPDFCAFASGSARTTSPGPGRGLILPAGSSYGLRCRPEPGSLLIADAPLQCEAFFLRFPGSSTVRWRAVRGRSQGDTPIVNSPQVAFGLDSTRVTLFITPDDVLTDLGDGRLELRLNATLPGVVPGDGVFFTSDTGSGCIATIRAIERADGVSSVTMDRPFSRMPVPGTQLRFGPVEIVRIAYPWPALNPDDPANWRGLDFTTSFDGPGAVLFSVGAWRPDVPGFVFGVAGWGGHGYRSQIDASADGAIDRWIRAAAPDLWVMAPAQQSSEPDTMTELTELVRQAAPDCEIVWTGDAAHPSGTFRDWFDYIRQHAPELGIAGVVAYEDPRIGDEWAQLIDGHRSDLAHLSRRGNRLMAEVWTDLLASAIRAPCVADWDRSGSVTDSDFFAFINDFFDPEVIADVGGDGSETDQDFFEFVNAYYGGCLEIGGAEGRPGRGA